MANDVRDDRVMKWQVDFEDFFDVFSTFIIDGNIDDIQPIIDPDDNSCSYVRVGDYFISKLYEQRTEDKKCVIIYDPTESDDKRFTIASPFTETVKESDSEDDPVEYERTYSDKLAQHFWEILHEDELDEQMIGHNAGGPSFDMARIHYAVTENGRMTENELIDKFKSFWDLINTEGGAKTTGYVFVIKMTSRLLSREGSSNGLGADELLLFRQLLNISQNIVKNSEHKLIILANKATDLPMWFIDETVNPFIKKMTIEKPSESNKRAFFDMLIDEVSFGEEFNRKYHAAVQESRSRMKPEDRESEFEKKTKRKFLAYTNDFSMKMLEYYQAYLHQGHKIDSPDKIGYSVSSFKAGTLENPWEDEEKVRDILRITDVVSNKIKGQEQALKTVQGILTRAAIGLGRVDNPNAPRVVLFLAGPTGTGKTEICKQLAEAIFGSEDRIVRFDMSEYGQEHADQKLFGAPPGYVGYEEGGKLTNAMKKEPFSLVLFDEIEKAHGSIMDKFLQILSDGRLTDGKGETVSFTDAIIAFTSNAGVTSPTPRDINEALDIEKKMGNEARPEKEMNMKAVVELEAAGATQQQIYDQVKEYFRYNVKHYFCCTLGRPELYGRIEDALVYYNYIGKDAVHAICVNKIKGITEEAIDKYKLAGVDYSAVVDAIVEHCQSERVRSMGARGIGKAVNMVFEGSLSDFISDYVTNTDGHNVAELVGRRVVCTLKDGHTGHLTSAALEWRPM